MSDQLSQEQVRHVARLSRLTLSEAEAAHFAGQLSSVLDYINKLNELNIEGIEPMAHAADMTNVLREDEPGQGLTVDAVLANAPAQMPPFFKVPKVLTDTSGA